MWKWKNLIFIVLAFIMLLIAIPQFAAEKSSTQAIVFSVIWVFFALLVIAAHLHQLLGVDPSEQRRLEAIKKMRKWRMEQLLRDKS